MRTGLGRLLPSAAGMGMVGVVEVVEMVEVGRMFPTLVRKLRHGPLCEAAVGCAVRVGSLDDETTRGGRVGSRLETRTRARD